MNMDTFLSLNDILFLKDNFETIEFENKTECFVIICYKIDYLDENISLKYILEQNKIFYELHNKTIFSSHIYRLLEQTHKKKYFTNDEISISDFLLNLQNHIANNAYNYCTCCAKEHLIKGTSIITHCDNTNCIKKFYHLVTDNRITELFNKDTNVLKFLINIMIIGSLHPKGASAFVPFVELIGIDTLDELKNIIEEKILNNKFKNIIDIISTCQNDLDFLEKTDNMIYGLVKNAISNNYFSMISKENIIQKTSTKSKTSIISINISYNASIENKFLGEHFLFHGSSLWSWYSIIKNGLKVMSGTALQANGAAYGNGIYLSDSFDMSFSYSSMTMNQSHSKNNFKNLDEYMLKDTEYKHVVGVFEICKEPSVYRKINQIFVVAEQNVLLLRTLVLLNSSIGISKDLSKYFTNDIVVQKKINKKGVVMLKNKRLNIEYNKLIKENSINNINIIDEFRWLIEFNKEYLKNKIVQIEFRFSNYPICPPEIVLLSNSFEKIKQSNNNFIDKNNNIRLKIIEPNEWNITTNLCLIIQDLLKCLIETL